MSLSNTTENATLKMHLQGTDPAYRAGATNYLMLLTADPGEAGAVANEATYTTNAAAYTAKIKALDEPVRQKLAAIPEAQRRRLFDLARVLSDVA